MPFAHPISKPAGKALTGNDIGCVRVSAKTRTYRTAGLPAIKEGRVHAYKTEQEQFWAGEFGEGYIARNAGDALHRSNVFFWRRVLQSMPQPASIAELGCNIGMNLRALNQLDPDIALSGFEINEQACAKANELGVGRVACRTIVDPLPVETQVDLSFTKGVLIHVNPDHLNAVYDNLHNISNKYIMIAEYYNPSPVSVNYRGHEGRLFKRDFAGEMMDRYDLKLIDYGFAYHRDTYAPQDDINWFLMAKP